MSKVLDFNSIQRPTLELTMKDDDHTVIRVSTPKEALIEKLSAGLKDLQEIVKRQDGESIRALFDLAADLINCNRNFITVTAEDLRDKYHMDFEDLTIFFGVYLDFIGDIQNAKN